MSTLPICDVCYTVGCNIDHKPPATTAELLSLEKTAKEGEEELHCAAYIAAAYLGAQRNIINELRSRLALDAERMAAMEAVVTTAVEWRRVNTIKGGYGPSASAEATANIHLTNAVDAYEKRRAGT